MASSSSAQPAGCRPCCLSSVVTRRANPLLRQSPPPQLHLHPRRRPSLSVSAASASAAGGSGAGADPYEALGLPRGAASDRVRVSYNLKYSAAKKASERGRPL